MADFYATLKKMISMTGKGGYIIFDVMDKNSPCYLKSKWLDLRDGYLKCLGIAIDERYRTYFVSISNIKKFLKKNNLTYHYWGERKITGNKDIMNTPKVVFCCRKEQ